MDLTLQESVKTETKIIIFRQCFMDWLDKNWPQNQSVFSGNKTDKTSAAFKTKIIAYPKLQKSQFLQNCYKNSCKIL